MLIDWADRSEAVINAWSAQSNEQRAARSLKTILDNLAEYPVASPNGDAIAASLDCRD